MTKSLSNTAIVGFLLGIAGCTTPQQQVSQKEDLLSAAGFADQVLNNCMRAKGFTRES